MNTDLSFQNKDMLSITDWTPAEVLRLCEAGKEMYELDRSGKRFSTMDFLKGRALGFAFYEPSTRTRISHNGGIGELGGRYDGFAGTEGTSVMKKETIRDTIKTMEQLHFDLIVMRHPVDGAVQWAADVARVPVINAGDGMNEHPTQGFLDLLTLYMLGDKKLDGINLGLGGDLPHGRTIRSLCLALSHFKRPTIRWAAEDFLGMPKDLEQLLLARDVKVIRENSVRDVMAASDFYYMTRPQLERMPGITQAQIMEMMAKYRIDESKVDGVDIKLLHPLPVNSEIAEIDYHVYFRPAQSFFPQTEFGLFLRKALIYKMLNPQGYLIPEGKLHPDLEYGNNRLKRLITQKNKKGRRSVEDIPYGIVIDHLESGTELEIAKRLGLKERGYLQIPADLPKVNKAFLKTDLGELTDRELKMIAMLSPEATVNIIRDSKVVEKFVYLLCNNNNCVTRQVNEDVPAKFYYDGESLRCRYCRRQYAIATKKVSPEEYAEFIKQDKMPRGIVPIHNPGAIAEGMIRIA